MLKLHQVRRKHQVVRRLSRDRLVYTWVHKTLSKNQESIVKIKNKNYRVLQGINASATPKSEFTFPLFNEKYFKN